MYTKQSLISYPYILKVSLWVMLGCSLLGSDLYAGEENDISACIETVFSQNKTLQEACLEAIINKNIRKVANILEGLDTNNLSEEQIKACHRLLKLNKEGRLRDLLLKNCIDPSQMPNVIKGYLVKWLNNLFPGPPSDKTNPEELEAYLSRMSNTQEHLQNFCENIISDKRCSKQLKEIILGAVQTIVKQRTQDLKRQIEVSQPNAYKEIFPKVDNLSRTMDRFFEQTYKLLEKSDASAYSGALTKEEAYIEGFEKDEVVIEMKSLWERIVQEVENVQIEDFLNSYPELLPCAQRIFDICCNKPLTYHELKEILDTVFDPGNEPPLYVSNTFLGTIKSGYKKVREYLTNAKKFYSRVCGHPLTHEEQLLRHNSKDIVKELEYLSEELERFLKIEKSKSNESPCTLFEESLAIKYGTTYKLQEEGANTRSKSKFMCDNLDYIKKHLNKPEEVVGFIKKLIEALKKKLEKGQKEYLPDYLAVICAGVRKLDEMSGALTVKGDLEHRDDNKTFLQEEGSGLSGHDLAENPGDVTLVENAKGNSTTDSSSIPTIEEVIKAIDALYGHYRKRELIAAIIQGDKEKMRDFLTKKRQKKSLSEDKKNALTLLCSANKENTLRELLLKRYIIPRKMFDSIKECLPNFVEGISAYEGTDLSPEQLADKLKKFKQGYREIVSGTDGSIMFKKRITSILKEIFLERWNKSSEEFPQELNPSDKSTPTIYQLKKDVKQFFEEVEAHLEAADNDSAPDSCTQLKNPRDVEQKIRKDVKELRSALENNDKEAILCCCNEIMSSIEHLSNIPDDQGAVYFMQIKRALQALFDAFDTVGNIASGEQSKGTVGNIASGQQSEDTVETIAGEQQGGDTVKTIASGEQGGDTVKTIASGEQGGDTVGTTRGNNDNIDPTTNPEALCPQGALNSVTDHLSQPPVTEDINQNGHPVTDVKPGSPTTSRGSTGLLVPFGSLALASVKAGREWFIGWIKNKINLSGGQHRIGDPSVRNISIFTDGSSNPSANRSAAYVNSSDTRTARRLKSKPNKLDPSSKSPVTDTKPSDSGKPKKFLRRGRIVLFAGAVAGGYQIYKHYVAKEKKASTTPVSPPAFPYKNTFLFMLWLLLIGLLIASIIFFHKKGDA